MAHLAHQQFDYKFVIAAGGLLQVRQSPERGQVGGGLEPKFSRMLSPLNGINVAPPKISTELRRARLQKSGIEATLPSDTAHISSGPSLADKATESSKKWAITGSVIASGVALAITGLGMFAGAPAQANEVVIERQVQQTTPQVLSQIEETPQMVVAGRHQAMLGAGRILKQDQFPGMSPQGLREQVDGAPNFRQVEGTNVYGVAQPTVQGLRNVLDRAGAREHTVMWTNMREEPVVYVNGRSFTLRLADHPFDNSTDYVGQTAERVERADSQLKDEVLREAQANGGRILLHGETADGSVVPEWVEISPGSVQTPKEVYQQLRAEGYQVDYARLPVTDEQAPEPKDLQALLERLKSVNPDTPLIFNCHAGRGRTTTAMVVAQLMQSARHGSDANFVRNPAVRADIREQGVYERGDYRLILSLIRNLEHGVQAKAETDAVLDRTEHIQNLRTDISRYRERSLTGADTHRQEAARERGKDYLQRYYSLITFNEYLKEQAPGGFQESYEDWLQARPELTRMLDSFELALNQGLALPGQASVGMA